MVPLVVEHMVVVHMVVVVVEEEVVVVVELVELELEQPS